MKRQILVLALTLPALALLGGCGGGTNTTTTDTNVIENTTTTYALPEEPLANVDNAIDETAMNAQQFANTAAASDAYEVAAGKLAQAKATTQALKDFGAMMVKDHTGSTAKLKTAAGKADPAITPDPTMTDEQKANLTALENATGAGFDAQYRSQQVAAHQKALGAIQAYAASGDVASIKDWASTVAPIVQKHLDTIQAMQ